MVQQPAPSEFPHAIEEYRIIQTRIAEFDNLAITIKSWSLTTSGAAIGVGILQHSAALYLLAAASACLFWYLEALNKVFQSALIDRSIDLEPMLRGEIPYDGVRTGDYFAKVTGTEEPARAVKIMFTYVNVLIPHAFISVAGIALYMSSVVF